MTQDELKTAVRKAAPGVYLFAGEEEYLKRHYVRAFRQSILEDDTLAAFNHVRFEARDIDFAALENAVSTPPMMSEKKLVEWHLADIDGLKDSEVTALLSLAETVKNDGHTVVVFHVQDGDFDAGTDKRPSKLYRRLSEGVHIVVFGRSSDTALSAWLQRHFRHNGIDTDPAFLREMLSVCGHDMDVLAGESEKISAYLLAHGEARATREVLHHVASVYTESDAFGLSDAILSGDGAAAFRVLRDMKFRRVEPTVILAQVSRVYADLLSVALLRREGEGKDSIAKTMKMHEYKVGIYLRAAEKRTPEALSRLLDLCRAADVASKSGGATGYDAVETLVATMLGRG